MGEKKDGILSYYFSEGLKRAIINGDSLIDASRILQKAEKFPYSIYLAYQGIEEYGKALLFLKDMSQEVKEISQKKWRTVYCSHETKMREVRRAISEKVYDVREISMPDPDTSELLTSEETMEHLIDFAIKEKAKNIYVDWDFDAYRWSSPLKIFSASYARMSSASVLVTARNARMALDIVLKEMDFAHLGKYKHTK